MSDIRNHHAACACGLGQTGTARDASLWMQAHATANPTHGRYRIYSLAELRLRAHAREDLSEVAARCLKEDT